MSKAMVSAPLARVERIGIVFGNGRSMAQVKAAAGCDWIINGGLYDFSTGKPVALLKAGGKVYATESWRAWGYAWNTGPDRRLAGQAGCVSGQRPADYRRI
jgi:N-acetylmuramoyl-L-alanine amidase